MLPPVITGNSEIIHWARNSGYAHVNSRQSPQQKLTAICFPLGPTRSDVYILKFGS
jgi:hypothetical protein